MYKKRLTECLRSKSKIYRVGFLYILQNNIIL